MTDARRRHPLRAASDHALRRPGRGGRCFVRRQARRHHRADRPQRRRQDHRVQLHHRLLQADGRHAPPHTRRRQRLPARAPVRLPHQQARARRPHLPEHPPVPGHDRARKPDGGAAQPADARLGHDRARPVRRRHLHRRRARGQGQGALLARPHRSDRARRRSGRRPCPMARSAGSRSRARCAPTRCCSASTSRPPA